MNGEPRLARRYHWLSETLADPCSDPHAAVYGLRRRDPIVNLSDARALASRRRQLDELKAGGDRAVERVREACRAGGWGRWAERVAQQPEQLILPGQHDVRADDVVMSRRPTGPSARSAGRSARPSSAGRSGWRRCDVWTRSPAAWSGPPARASRSTRSWRGNAGVPTVTGA